MGTADVIVRNYSTMAKIALRLGFTYGIFYSVVHGTSPLCDARRALGALRLTSSFNR